MNDHKCANPYPPEHAGNKNLWLSSGASEVQTWECYSQHLPRPSVDTLLDIIGEVINDLRPQDVPWALREIADWYHDGHPEDRNYAPALGDVYLCYDNPPTQAKPTNRDGRPYGTIPPGRDLR